MANGKCVTRSEFDEMRRQFIEACRHLDIANSELGVVKEGLATIRERIDWNTKITYGIFAAMLADVILRFVFKW